MFVSTTPRDFTLNNSCEWAESDLAKAVEYRKVGWTKLADQAARHAHEWAWEAYLIAQRE